MNDFNQQCVGMADCGCRGGRGSMPVWQGRSMESGMFDWPSQTTPETDCGTPPVTVMPAWQGGAPSPAAQPQIQPQMQQPQMQPVQQAPMSFAARMDAGRFPLAMSYVPIQQWSQPSPMEEGFRRGTIFAELDLPFLMGRCCR